MSAWSLRDLPPPWGDRPSIYEHIRAQLSAGPSGDAPVEITLPDDDRPPSRSHAGPVAEDRDEDDSSWTVDEARAGASVFGALKRATHAATAANVRNLYNAITARSGIDFIPPFDSLLLADRTVDRNRVRALARWFARGAADRVVVQWALSNLAVVSGEDIDLVLVLGRHEEFTWSAVNAARHGVRDREKVIWELAKHATDWTRSHAVNCLRGTSDEAIKGWMLREGFDFTIPHSAYTRATAGGLLDALSREQIDDALLVGAGRILHGLIRYDPAGGRGMSDYAEGARAVEAYLGHVRRSTGTLEQVVVVDAIWRYCRDERRDWPALAAHGWAPARRARIERAARDFLIRRHWGPRVIAELSGDGGEFNMAVVVARALGIDTWDHEFRRLVRGEERWCGVMETEDPERVERVVALALERLDLAAIATGPATEWGIGPAFRRHRGLEHVVDGLARFPGTGLALVHAALQSPVVTNRESAVRTLAAWGEWRWGRETRALLEAARSVEPLDDVREEMEQLLAGEWKD